MKTKRDVAEEIKTLLLPSLSKFPNPDAMEMGIRCRATYSPSTSVLSDLTSMDLVVDFKPLTMAGGILILDDSEMKIENVGLAQKRLAELRKIAELQSAISKKFGC